MFCQIHKWKYKTIRSTSSISLSNVYCLFNRRRVCMWFGWRLDIHSEDIVRSILGLSTSFHSFTSHQALALLLYVEVWEYRDNIMLTKEKQLHSGVIKVNKELGSPLLNALFVKEPQGFSLLSVSPRMPRIIQDMWCFCGDSHWMRGKIRQWQWQIKDNKAIILTLREDKEVIKLGE